jgi:hypothetical protein
MVLNIPPSHRPITVPTEEMPPLVSSAAVRAHEAKPLDEPEGMEVAVAVRVGN